MEYEKRLTRALADRYELEGELDRGGMAVVYTAKDLRHDRKVAIKVLLPSLSATVGTERFLREVDVIAKLEHPNILTLIDSGEVEGLPYYVMPFVKGQSLAALLKREGRLPLQQAVQIAEEVADALETAHRQGIIHRDIKPSNVLLSGGHAVVADFGIATALDESGLGRLTQTGASLGSPIYMSPEQASGEREHDGRTDIYALGCMLYEMLAGEPPFDGSLKAVMSRKVSGEYRPLKELVPELPPEIDKAVSKALQREKEKRFATAGEFREALLQGLPKEAPRGWGRKRTMAAAAAVLVVVAAAVAAVVQNRRASALQVWRVEALAEIERLADGGRYTEALERAGGVETRFPGDTTLARLYPEFSFTVPVRTDPPGARVYIQDMEEEAGDWEYLGETPMESVRFAGIRWETEEAGVNYTEDRTHRIRFELEGYRTREFLKTAIIGSNYENIPPLDPVALHPTDPELERMVRIPGSVDDSTAWKDFFFDRYEVTNKEYKEFVDAGGYRDPEYWIHPFVLDGSELSFDEAMEHFRDQTGRPGPSTWRVGNFPEGEADYPVGGVSWHEAAAYARWSGKDLPTVSQWNRGRLRFQHTNYITVSRSNLMGSGPRPVGANDAMAALGLYDMTGNVREWCYNEAGEGQRATRGGAWPDPTFMSGWVIPKPAFDRDPTHGFRLLRAFEDEDWLEVSRRPVTRTEGWRDYSVEEPVSDAEFEAFRRMFEYERLPLNAVVERADTFEHWVRETITFDLPYGERGGVFLHLPRQGQGPFQPIMHWGGSGILDLHSIDEQWIQEFDYMLMDGRAVAVPWFKGAYGRDDPDPSAPVFPGPMTGLAYRDATIKWVTDLSVSLDYLETRPDIDPDHVGFYGFSFGARIGPIPLAIEPRLDAAVLNVGGLRSNQFYPAADPFNYTTRVRTPVLMLNGQFDSVFPYEPSQVPLFQWLGTPDKRHVVVPATHLVPKDEVIGETLAWYDKYLGVPGGG